MKATRIYNDPAGESHFDDIEYELTERAYAPPALPFLVSEPLPVSAAVLATMPGGWDGGDWHPTPVRQLFFQLSGTLEVKVSDGEARRFGAGAIVLVEDTEGKGHATAVVGDTPVSSVFVRF